MLSFPNLKSEEVADTPEDDSYDGQPHLPMAYFCENFWNLLKEQTEIYAYQKKGGCFSKTDIKELKIFARVRMILCTSYK